MIASADEDVGQQELSFTAGENEKWYLKLRRYFGSFVQLNFSFHAIQQLYSLMSTHRSWKLPSILNPVHGYL